MGGLKRPKRKTARRYIRARAASWRQVVQPFACSKNGRGDSLAQERALLSWAIDGHCRKSGGVRFSATAIHAARESAGVIFVAENGKARG
jgi:hypothetical protein